MPGRPPSTARMWLGALAFGVAVAVAEGAYVLVVTQTGDDLTLVVPLIVAVILALSAGLVAATEAWRLPLKPGACLATVVSVLALAILVWPLAFDRDLFTCWSCYEPRDHGDFSNGDAFVFSVFILSAFTGGAAVALGVTVAMMRLIRRRMTS